MPSKNVDTARDCPKCSSQINQTLSGHPWPLLLCNRCLVKETKRAKQADRSERRQKGGHSLSVALLRFQAEPAPVQLENPVLRADDLPSDVLNWLNWARLSVEMLETVSAPFGHALLAYNPADSIRGTERSSTSNSATKQEDSTYPGDSTSSTAMASGNDSKMLFISGLHRDINKTTLSWFFKDFTHDIPFIRQEWNKRGKAEAVCWAMVEVSTPSEAARAVQNLNGKESMDCKVSVQLHRPRTSLQSFEPLAYNEPDRTLYIRGIEVDVTEDKLLCFMDDFKARVHVLKNEYAVVEVSSNAEALRAIDTLDKQRIFKREIRVQLNRTKRHEPVPGIHIRQQRATTALDEFEGGGEPKVHSTFSRIDVVQEVPRQAEYHTPRAWFNGAMGVSPEHIPVNHLDQDVEYKAGAIRHDVGTMSQVSDVASTGVLTQEREISWGTNDWVPGVLTEILKMEMASRPSSWLDVVTSVQRELQHQLMADITEGDPIEGTPISVPLLELLDHRVQELRRL